MTKTEEHMRNLNLRIVNLEKMYTEIISKIGVEHAKMSLKITELEKQIEELRNERRA